MSNKKEKEPPIGYINFYFRKDPTKVEVYDKDKNKSITCFLSENKLIKGCKLIIEQFHLKLKRTEEEINSTIAISSILKKDILIQVREPTQNKNFYPLESISEVFDIDSSEQQIKWPYYNDKALNLFTPIGSIYLQKSIELRDIRSNEIPKISLLIRRYINNQPKEREFKPFFDFREVDIDQFVNMVFRMIGCIEPKHAVLSYCYNDFTFKADYLLNVKGKMMDFPLHESNCFTVEPVSVRWVYEQNEGSNEYVDTTDYSKPGDMMDYIKAKISQKYQIPINDLTIENIPKMKKNAGSCAMARLLQQSKSFLKVSIKTSNHSHDQQDNFSKSQASKERKHPNSINNDPKNPFSFSQKPKNHNKESSSESSDENPQITSNLSLDNKSLNRQNKNRKSKDPELSKSVTHNSSKKPQPENYFQSQGSHRIKNTTTKTQNADEKSYVSNDDLISDDENEANVEERAKPNKQNKKNCIDNLDVPSATPLPKPNSSVPVEFSQHFISSIDNSTFRLTFDKQEVPYKEIIQQVSEKVQRKPNDIQLSKNEIVYKTTQPVPILNDGIPIIISIRPFIVKFKMTQENRLIECDKLNKNMAISEVKDVLANELNVDSSLIRLNFAGKKLHDNAILNNLHLNPKSIINIFIEKESELLVTVAALNPTHFDLNAMIGELRVCTNRDEDLCRAILRLKNYDIEASIKALNEVYKAELCDEELENDEDGSIEEQIDKITQKIGGDDLTRLRTVLPKGINLYHGILIWDECDKNMGKVKSIVKST